MAKLLSKIYQGRLILIASPPVNTVDLALAAQEAGADAVETHLNHESSMGRGAFSSIDLEEQALKDIVSVLNIPVGVSIGGSKPLQEEEWERLLALNIDFVNMLAHHMPAFVALDERVSRIVGIGPGYILEQVKAISDSPGVSAIEAAVVPPQAFGLPLNVLDVATLEIVTKLSAKPILVPTQKKIRPAEVPIIRQAGCKGLSLTSVVTGDTPTSMATTIKAFTTAILPHQ